ncbi:MAG: hypothetical protein IPO08_23850 [Xanthomonadales bacterium]|nr:hypothetical protein [Xanthomonadales bacterium]
MDQSDQAVKSKVLDAEQSAVLVKFLRAVGEPENRPVIITPFAGHYGLAGYMVVVEGSPAKAVLVVILKSYFKSEEVGIARLSGFGKPVRMTNPVKQALLAMLMDQHFVLEAGGDVPPAVTIEAKPVVRISAHTGGAE